VQAQPNITLAIVAEPTYWVTFGIIRQGGSSRSNKRSPGGGAVPAQRQLDDGHTQSDQQLTVKTNLMLAATE